MEVVMGTQIIIEVEKDSQADSILAVIADEEGNELDFPMNIKVVTES
tara:strand:- start:653 stop:793 length:141 start_codon:yes stop_codon:yes gene_type:complete